MLGPRFNVITRIRLPTSYTVGTGAQPVEFQKEFSLIVHLGIDHPPDIVIVILGHTRYHEDGSTVLRQGKRRGVDDFPEKVELIVQEQHEPGTHTTVVACIRVPRAWEGGDGDLRLDV